MTTATEGGARQSVTRMGVLISLVILLGLVIGVTARNLRPPDLPANTFVLHMSDYSYTPSHMVWTVGSTVTVTIVNETSGHPGQPHEWMVGREANSDKTVFGKAVADGFETSFFDGVNIDVLDGNNLLMLMGGSATLSGKPASALLKPGIKPQMMGAMSGFMPVTAPSGSLTISFKVPDKPGEWSYGCFQQSGQHFLNGMRGTITVKKG